VLRLEAAELARQVHNAQKQIGPIEDAYTKVAPPCATWPCSELARRIPEPNREHPLSWDLACLLLAYRLPCFPALALLA